MNTLFDRKTTSTRERKRKGKDQLFKAISNLELVDIWRKRNPRKSRLTYRNRSASVQSRLDLWLVSENFTKSVSECEIIPSVAPDHSAVTLTLVSKPHSHRGPGFWKFNCEVLKDDNFVTGMRKQIEESETRNANIKDPRTKWELVKCDISYFTIRYSKTRAKQKKHQEKELEK